MRRNGTTIKEKRKIAAGSFKEASNRTLCGRIRKILQSDEMHLWSSAWAPLLLDQLDEGYSLYEMLGACDILRERRGEEYVRKYVQSYVNGNTYLEKLMIRG